MKINKKNTFVYLGCVIIILASIIYPIIYKNELLENLDKYKIFVNDSNIDKDLK
jgi:hypothetical protein